MTNLDSSSFLALAPADLAPRPPAASTFGPRRASRQCRAPAPGRESRTDPRRRVRRRLPDLHRQELDDRHDVRRTGSAPRWAGPAASAQDGLASAARPADPAQPAHPLSESTHTGSGTHHEHRDASSVSRPSLARAVGRRGLPRSPGGLRLPAGDSAPATTALYRARPDRRCARHRDRSRRRRP